MRQVAKYEHDTGAQARQKKSVLHAEQPSINPACLAQNGLTKKSSFIELLDIPGELEPKATNAKHDA
jgi:hypothetical protein